LKFGSDQRVSDFVLTYLGIMEGHIGPDGIQEIRLTPYEKPIKLKICANDFDSRGNMKFPCLNGEIQSRGDIPYHQPSRAWYRQGLRVMGIYPDDEWMSMSGSAGEWAVGFHGTLCSGEKGLSSIASTRFFGVGSAHACSNHVSKALHTNGQQYGGKEEEAIYFTKDIEHCYKLVVDQKNSGGGKYEIAFQCRINPKFFYDSDPQNPGSYCVVRGPENIRPYGICFKKID